MEHFEGVQRLCAVGITDTKMGGTVHALNEDPVYL